MAAGIEQDPEGATLEDHGRIGELAADAVPWALLVIHNSGSVALVNAAARRLFRLSGADIGRHFQDLEISFWPAELPFAVEQVQKEQRPIVLEQVPWADGPDGLDCLDIHVVPVSDATGTGLGVALTFSDVSLSLRLQDDLEHSNRDLETAYEELQSTNEVLVTMNAELHSTNEELQRINDELRVRTTELDELNDFLECMLLSRQAALAVIDRDMRITVWNQQAAELWGVRPDEAPGQHFLNLDIGLPVEELRQPIKTVLTRESDREALDLAATNRRGREFHCGVSLTPLINRQREVRGVIILMEVA